MIPTALARVVLVLLAVGLAAAIAVIVAAWQRHRADMQACLEYRTRHVRGVGRAQVPAPTSSDVYAEDLPVDEPIPYQPVDPVDHAIDQARALLAPDTPQPVDEAGLPPVPAWLLDHLWWQIRCYLTAASHPDPPVIPGREDQP